MTTGRRLRVICDEHHGWERNWAGGVAFCDDGFFGGSVLGSIGSNFEAGLQNKTHRLLGAVSQCPTMPGHAAFAMALRKHALISWITFS